MHGAAQPRGLVEKAPWLDLVAGPDSYRRLPELLGRARFDPAVDVRLDRGETYADIAPEHQGGVRAFVTVMRGCDKFCAFCVVPYVRGRERSVPPEAILAESVDSPRAACAKSCCSGRRSTRIASATSILDVYCAWSPQLTEWSESASPRRIPRDMSDSVIEAMATEPKVQPALHLPLQSGSDRMLAAMERGYTVAEYLDLVERLRAAIPGIALSTDIIVGFHGEEEPDFRATLDLMAELRYDSAFSFKYSVRENTRAFRLGDSVSEEEKGRRLAEVIALQERFRWSATALSSGSVSRCWSKDRRAGAPG